MGSLRSAASAKPSGFAAKAAKNNNVARQNLERTRAMAHKSEWMPKASKQILQRASALLEKQADEARARKAKTGLGGALARAWNGECRWQKWVDDHIPL